MEIKRAATHWRLLLGWSCNGRFEIPAFFIFLQPLGWLLVRRVFCVDILWLLSNDGYYVIRQQQQLPMPASGFENRSATVRVCSIINALLWPREKVLRPSFIFINIDITSELVDSRPKEMFMIA
jgi:hypothetical protein